jgi:thioredoxin 1
VVVKGENMRNLKLLHGNTKLSILITLVILFGLVYVISVSNQCCSPNKPPQSTTANNETADNPLAKALKSGLPVVVDFGRGTCIPCKMMKPILEELAITYKGKAEILIIDIGQYPDLVLKYEINLIPVQLFFDKSGQDVWRHEGFLEKDKIIEQLKELGVE